MTVTTTYPGVYLSEDAVSSFSVNSAATAVPLFAYDSENTNTINKPIQVFRNWAEFTVEYPTPLEDAFYTSLSLWFMHGGGKCYLVNEANIADAVAQYDDITLIVAAGTDTTTYTAFTTVVGQGYRIFGLFDGPKEKIAGTAKPDEVMEEYPTSPFGAVFYPWGTLASGAAVPPSAIAAASITQTDRTRGVWKAPANQAVNGVTPAFAVSDDFQGKYNQGKALNMIRTFSGQGTVVWGARTLEDSDNWRYIPVRRLFNAVERDIQKSLNKLVFEPNSQPTWQRVKAAVDSYLHSLWQQGALAGNTPADAWFVQVGKDLTMTQEEINQGKMIIKIGLAAVRPAEFIILQFSQDIAQ
ncbi:Phage tail sheath protein [Serratia entomophila]|uniref:AfpX2 n=2 Tax=Serratia TaxID=613 RepID=A0A2R2Q2H3_SERPR|nr:MULTISPECIES: phage tail sheath C-terminal domain-containing protein [Serratia]6RAO_C Chain C, Afp2 [Serratia entomophila]6RAP_C Chain C, Afp2 [Serratia entomophila]6RBN_C Chain C, Afp2 [Serratia entomophila]6RC8_A Chain A, Afp2 [Serratia entomophila]6RGL_A Chain A, Afp2 [Serratia entomophila]6RGL_B Chain B, Afp2 [Serratia entomophila]AAT48339.1 Afp2 [Serratia entomophila]ANV21601.1 AfpX2 [Serratia proteamaculans]UIW20822.1 phage tail sheath subtilisin-like domain-containing protein [Se